jgi:hypothetical protein
MSKRWLALTLLLSSWLLGAALAQSVPTLKINLWYVDGLELEIHDHQLAVDLYVFAHFFLPLSQLGSIHPLSRSREIRPGQFASHSPAPLASLVGFVSHLS